MIPVPLLLLRFVYALFYERLPRQFWIFLTAFIGLPICGFLLAFLLTIWIGLEIPRALVVGVVLLPVLTVIGIAIECLRIIAVALWRKQPGAWLFAGGLCSVLLFALVAATCNALGIRNPLPTESYVFAIFVLAAPLVAMSVFLSRRVAQTSRAREFIQTAFGQYLAPTVVEQLVESPEMLGQLGGEERVMTAFFSDITSFTTLSESLTPNELVNFINQYLSEMCAIIEEYGGTVDKFEGDAIVAFFGAPIFFQDHAVRATMACIDQQKKLQELRHRWRQEGDLPRPLVDLWTRWEAEGRTFCHVRMGLAAGPMVVGNMGSQHRTDYTMMGDTVNLAARFESGQKIYGTGIMVNDVVYGQVREQVEARKLDTIQVVGKEEPVTAYEILGRKGELTEEQYRVLELYDRGMAAYETFEFAGARDLFQQVLEIDPTDGPSTLYADRCEEFAADPPEDLIFRAEIK